MVRDEYIFFLCQADEHNLQSITAIIAMTTETRRQWAVGTIGERMLMSDQSHAPSPARLDTGRAWRGGRKHRAVSFFFVVFLAHGFLGGVRFFFFCFSFCARFPSFYFSFLLSVSVSFFFWRTFDWVQLALQLL